MNKNGLFPRIVLVLDHDLIALFCLLNEKLVEAHGIAEDLGVRPGFGPVLQGTQPLHRPGRDFELHPGGLAALLKGRFRLCQSSTR